MGIFKDEKYFVTKGFQYVLREFYEATGQLEALIKFIHGVFGIL